MLKFFRRIRMRLLDRGSFRKYIIYALGEILLVVIGILLALQINTWSRNQNNKRYETKMLQNILSDLESDIQAYKTGIEGDSIKFAASATLLQIFKNKEYLSDSEFLELGQKRMYVTWMEFQNASYMELLNAGKVELIKKDTLRKKILNYYSRQSGIKSRQEKLNQVIIDAQMEFGLQKLEINSIGHYLFEDIPEVDPVNFDFFKKETTDEVFVEFINRLSMSCMIYKAKINIYNSGLKQAEVLSKDIKNYLD